MYSQRLKPHIIHMNIYNRQRQEEYREPRSTVGKKKNRHTVGISESMPDFIAARSMAQQTFASAELDISSSRDCAHSFSEKEFFHAVYILVNF